MASETKLGIQKNGIFIVVGRLGKNLVVSKVLPVLKSKLFFRIFIFSEEKGIEIPGVEYITLPWFLSRIRPIIIKKLVRIIFEPIQLICYSILYKPSIIHGYYVIPKGFNSLIASKLSDSRCVVSIIGGKEEVETSFFIYRFSRPIIIWLLKKADFVTTKGISDNVYLNSYGIEEDKIGIFNGAIDTRKFCYTGEKKDIDILFAGYFDEFKGPQRALEIICLVKKDFPDIRATFIGKGPLFQSIVYKSEKLGMSANITFTGYVNDAESYYKRSKILIFPSANEGLSTAMLEAMACHCVPITSDVGNQIEAATNGYNSVVIPDYKDVQSFAISTINLLRDEYRLNSMADNAEKTIQSKYTPEVQGELCLKFYSQLIQKTIIDDQQT